MTDGDNGIGFGMSGNSVDPSSQYEFLANSFNIQWHRLQGVGLFVNRTVVGSVAYTFLAEHPHVHSQVLFNFGYLVRSNHF